MAYTPAATNALGAVVLFDSENPCIFTARVNGTVSGGQFVMISGTNGAGIISSGADSYTATDINVCPALLYDNVGGIALQNVASGTANYVSVARKGCFIVQAVGPVSGGAPVVFNSGGVTSLFTVGSATVPTGAQYYQVGRALVTSDDASYTICALNL